MISGNFSISDEQGIKEYTEPDSSYISRPDYISIIKNQIKS